MKYGEKHAAEAAASELREKFPSIHSVGVGTDGLRPALYAYLRKKKDGKEIPPEFGGFKVVRRVVGEVRPAKSGRTADRLSEVCRACSQPFGSHGATPPHTIGEPELGDVIERACSGFVRDEA